MREYNYNKYLGMKRKNLLKEEKELLRRLNEVRKELNVIELKFVNKGVEVPLDKIERVEAEEELMELKTGFAKDKKKRKRPSYKSYMMGNAEIEERRKKREKRLRQEMLTEVTVERNEEPETEVIEESTEENEITIEKLVKKFRNAEKKTRKTVKAGQEETEEWYEYALDFRVKLKEEMERGLKNQTARGRIYAEMERQMPENSRVNIRKKTQRAEKILEIFTVEGKQKIKTVKITSVNILAKMKMEELVKFRSRIFGEDRKIREVRKDSKEVNEEELIISGTTTPMEM